MCCMHVGAHFKAEAACTLQVGSLASSAGVGGGAIYIPLLQALVGFGALTMARQFLPPC